tara:strand:+ start:511 stop:771 length:261 start_codon:yes stop_codon:yes gene_type:complete
MEWAIFFTLVVVATAKSGLFAIQWTEKSEPSGPFRRPTLVGRLPGEVSLNDMSIEQRRRFIQNLQRRQRQRQRWVEEKVDWKAEGF